MVYLVNKFCVFLCFVLIFIEFGISQIAKQKCIEYSQIKCPNHHRSKRIIGGTKVDNEFKFPHQLLIEYGPKDKPTGACSGTLISDQWVLTVAHCLYQRYNHNEMFVDIGFINKEHRNASGMLQSFKIIERVVHPNYTRRSVYNDIALLKLDRPVILSESVFPACLHDDFNIPVSNAVATGWGVTSFGTTNRSNVLMEATLPIVDLNACKELYPQSRRIGEGLKDDQICAGEIGKDTCWGDSGTPLQIKEKNSCLFNIIGISSFGTCFKGPSIYTRVSHFI